MKNEFTAIIERDGDWYIAYCPEIPGANGQGRTKDEARENLAEAIELILEDRREDALRGVPPDAVRETVRVNQPERTAPAALQHGCYLKRPGSFALLWTNPGTGAVEAIPRHTDISNLLARTIC